MDRVLIALPLLALAGAAFSEARWLRLFVYPVSHLPALVLIDEIAGPRVYGGADGLRALTAITVVAAAWTMLATRGLPRRRAGGRSPGGRVLPVVTAIYGVGVFGAFASAALQDRDGDPFAACVTLLVGLGATWHAAGRLVALRLGDVIVRPEARELVLAGLRFVEAPSRGELFGALAVAAIALAVALVWYAL